MPARARSRRQHSIRVLLAVMCAVPLACLLVLWIVAVVTTVGAASRAHNFATADQQFAGPAQTLSGALSAERRQTFTWLAGTRRASRAPMLSQFKATDAAATSFLAVVRANPGLVPSSAKPALSAFESALAGRSALRAGVQSGQTAALTAFSGYSQILAAQFVLYDTMAAASDGELYQQAAASADASRAAELADAEVTLVDGAGRVMSQPARVQFAQAVASRRLTMDSALSRLEPDLGAGYQHVQGSADYNAFSSFEDRVVAAVGRGGPLPVSSAQFGGSGTALESDYQAAARQNADALVRLAATRAHERAVAAWLAVGLGLAAVVVCAVLLLGVGWWIRREIVGLGSAAVQVTTTALPRLLERAQDSEEVGLAGVAALPTARIREIGQAGAAVTVAVQAAVESTALRARQRRAAAQLFRALAWRTEVVLQRQRALLDVLEHSAAQPPPAELSALGRLTARLLHQADSLLILAGSTPSRSGRRSPLLVADVLYAAVAQADDATRVSVTAEGEDRIVGDAAADVVHLVCELVENAAQHSPPGADIAVRASRVGRGLAVEVEDRGTGLSQAELENVNAKLAGRPEPDLSPDDELGLIVTVRLAAKHGIKVALRPAPLGGTTAVVLLPHALLVTSQATETIVDGSLPRIDPALPPVPPPLELAAAQSATAAIGPAAGAAVIQPSGRVAPYVPPLDDPQPAERTTAWHWLSESPSPAAADIHPGTGRHVLRAAAARPPAVEALGIPEDGGTTAAGLPRRVRLASLMQQPGDTDAPVPVPPAGDTASGPGPEATA